MDNKAKFKDGSTYAKQWKWLYIIMEAKTHLISSLDVEKAFDKIYGHFMVTTFFKSGLEGKLFSLRKGWLYYFSIPVIKTL